VALWCNWYIFNVKKPFVLRLHLQRTVCIYKTIWMYINYVDVHVFWSWMSVPNDYWEWLDSKSKNLREKQAISQTLMLVHLVANFLIFNC